MTDARIAAAQASRAAFLWLGVHLLAAGAAAFGGARDALEPAASVRASAIVIGAVLVLTLADMRAMREHVFLANLGIALHTSLAVAGATALTLEILWTLGRSALS